MQDEVSTAIEKVAADTGFSGVLYLSRGDEVLFGSAWGLANRAHALANTLDTQFGIASGAKGFTGLGTMALVTDGSLALDTSVREIIGDELEMIDPAVTVEHLLSHTSGIGDYLDESLGGDINDYAMPVSVHELAEPSDFLAVLRGFPMKFTPGERFEYCNGGFVVLSLVIEAASGASYHDFLDARVFGPAGMSSTAFLRSDELPGSAAIGYLGDGPRTNVFHLPVRGVGDGGTYSTVGDMRRFWDALFAGKILPNDVVDEMVRPRHDVPSESMRYGLGFWLRPDMDTVMLVGYDAGVSFRSAFDPASGLLCTLMSNTSDGVWPIAKKLDEMWPDLVTQEPGT